jgi:hypothetical protein
LSTHQKALGAFVYDAGVCPFESGKYGCVLVKVLESGSAHMLVRPETQILRFVALTSLTRHPSTTHGRLPASVVPRVASKKHRARDSPRTG